MTCSLNCTSINKESIVDVEGEIKAAAQKVQSCSQEDVEILVEKVMYCNVVVGFFYAGFQHKSMNIFTDCVTIHSMYRPV